MNYIIILTFIFTFLISIFLNNFFVKRPLKFLVKKANNSALRFSSQTKPIFGGISFYVIFLVVTISCLFIFNKEVYYSAEFISLFIIITLSFFMGLADDLISTPPIFKFVVQLLCSLIFISNGIYITISPIDWINYLLTVLWVVGIMNSINMLDNMDAVASVVSLSIISGVIFFSLIFMSPISDFGMLILIGVAASLLAFLFYNWNPSKMYMGDNGSQFLGVILAWIGIVFFWNSIPIENLQYAQNIKQALIVGLAYIIPLSDTTTVTINRILKKKSPFVGGNDHTTHYLHYLGLPVKWVGVLLFLLNSIGIIFSLYIIQKGTSITYNKLWVFFIFPVITFLFLFLNTKFSKIKN